MLNHWMVERQSIPNIRRVLMFICLNDVDIVGAADENPRIKVTSSNYVENVISFLRRNSKLYILLKNMVSDRSKVYFQYNYQNIYRKENKTFIEAMCLVDKMNSLLQATNIDFQIVILALRIPIENRRGAVSYAAKTPRRSF